MKRTFYTTCLLLTCITGTAQPGSLDMSFDNDGKVTTHFQLYNDAISKATVIQSDGKIIVAGYSYNNSSKHDFTVARYNTNGTIDNSFGANGIVITAISSNDDEANAVALQGDGKIVVAGYSAKSSSDLDFAVVRYNVNGTPDNTFGINGIVSTALGSDWDVINSIAIQQDGKIVAAGYTYNGNAKNDIAIVRYNVNGTPDNAFGINGIVITAVGSLNDEANSVKIQQDGKIVAGGCSQYSANYDFALARYNADGSPDNTFGAGGKVTTHFASNSSINSIAILKNGKIVAAGYYGSSITHIAMIRYKPNGKPDKTFGSEGIVITNIDLLNGELCYSVAIRPDNKIVLGCTSDKNFVVVRYDSNGAPDDNFGSHGIVKTIFTGYGSSAAYAIAIQGNGKILMAGYTYDSSGSCYVFAIARYNINGSLDNNFASGGIVTTNVKDLNPSIDVGQSVAIQEDGKIITAGYSYTNFSSDLSLCRLNADGQPDNTFASGGKATSNFLPGNSFAAYSIALSTQWDNIWIVGKSYNPLAGNDDFGLFIYDFNGYNLGYNHIAIGNGDDIAYAVARQADGKIIVAGISHNGNNYDFALIRCPVGVISPDASFSGDGKLTKDIAGGNDYAYAVAIQTDGKIVVTGASFNGTNYDIALLRYLSDGNPDNSFGSDGIVKTSLSKTSNDYGRSVKIQPDGKIVVAGYTSNGSANDFIIVRYNSNGVLDNSFNSNGIVSGSFEGTSNDFCNSIALQQDGKIVIGGYYYKNSVNKTDFALARYLSNGKPDGSFGLTGKVSTDFSSADDFENSMAIQPDGKIVVAGSSGNDLALARYNSSGTLILKSVPGNTGDKISKNKIEPGSVILFPNPVSSKGAIIISNPETENTTVELWDASRKLRTMYDGILLQGIHQIEFNRENLPAGVYFLRIINNSQAVTKKLVIE
ncbi:MAG TPA: T9SS type A sorting domain-containing protein [Parafilimonas sp.]|nr:T9SS type A sorting domain-containing protein [Parafilimonas sp.]